MSTPMHILIIPSWYPLFKGDISGSFFREQAIALKNNEYTVGVIYPQISGLKNLKRIIKKPYGITIENDEGVKILRGHSINFLPKFKNYNKNHWIKIALKLFEIYIEKYGKPDIIHVHSMLYGGFVALEIQKKYGISYIITEHSTAYARKLVSKSVIEALKPVVKEAKECIAVSLEFTQLLNQLIEEKKWLYVPNIVNNSFFENDLVISKCNPFTFINICFLDAKKRVDILIIAFTEAFKNNKEIKLKIGGDGPELENLKLLCSELQMDSQISFLGRLSRENVRKEIEDSNAFVLSSEYETFGVVLIEALALGKPVIATKCGGPESIVNKEVGYLIDKNSINEMKLALLQLYNSQNHFISSSIRKYCYENFSEEAVITRLSKIYHEHCNINE